MFLFLTLSENNYRSHRLSASEQKTEMFQEVLSCKRRVKKNISKCFEIDESDLS